MQFRLHRDHSHCDEAGCLKTRALDTEYQVNRIEGYIPVQWPVWFSVAVVFFVQEMLNRIN